MLDLAYVGVVSRLGSHYSRLDSPPHQQGPSEARLGYRDMSPVVCRTGPDNADTKATKDEGDRQGERDPRGGAERWD